MAKRLLENKPAEQEADRIGALFANSNDVKGDMGKAFNFDFSGVGLHGGAEGESMAASHGDLAYAQGNNAYFGGDILDSHTPEANMVIGHELTHVMQQNEGAGVSEHVAFGESQGLSFSGMFKGIGNFFKNLFTRKKKTKDMDAPEVLELPEVENETDAPVAQTKEEAPETATANTPAQENENNMPAAQSLEDVEREQLYQKLLNMGFVINRYVKGLPLDQLRELVDKRVNEYKMQYGGMMEGFEEPDMENRNRPDIDEKELQELRTKDFYNEDIESVANQQKEQGIENTVNEKSLQFMRFSQGFYNAQLLVRSTSFGKALYKKLEDADQTKFWERMYKGFKPVMLDAKGGFLTDQDKNNHDWNMSYLREIAGNEGTTAMAELTDEIVGYGALMDAIVDNPEDPEEIVYSNSDVFNRLGVIGLTFDMASKTEAYKKYLKAENGGVEPKSKDEWPIKAKYADMVVQMFANFGAYMDLLEKENGLYAKDYDSEFIRNDGTQKTSAFKREDLGTVIGLDRDAYNAVRKAFRLGK